jgi:hypothetical protein
VQPGFCNGLVLLSFFRRSRKKPVKGLAELIMDAHPILKGVGIAVAIIVLVGIRLGLFRYIFEKITDRMARPED